MFRPGPAILFFVSTLAATAQTGMRDRYFLRYPFDTWKTEKAQAQIKWSDKILEAHLSPHQRLTTRIQIEIDHHEIEKRLGRGQLIVFIEITDAPGRRWRTHLTVDLARIQKKTQRAAYTQDVFILPGEYRISLAVCDSETLEHSFVERTFRASALRGDPLPEAWRDLPAVEFVRNFGGPEFWFQPYVRGRVQLSLATSKAVHVDLIMNLTPSERASGSIRNFRNNMSVLVPALKVLSGIQLRDGSLDVTLLDLTRRRAWEEKDAHGLDWPMLREPLVSNSPGVIDAHSLAARAEMRQFLWDEVAGRLSPEDTTQDGKQPLRVVIVLGAPVFLGRQYKVETEPVPRDSKRRVYYLRYRPVPPARPVFDPFTQTARPAVNALPSDDVGNTLKPLDVRVFGAITPQEFRKAVASMLAEISRM
jgi:hypothetical protein